MQAKGERTTVRTELIDAANKLREIADDLELDLRGVEKMRERRRLALPWAEQAGLVVEYALVSGDLNWSAYATFRKVTGAETSADSKRGYSHWLAFVERRKLHPRDLCDEVGEHVGGILFSLDPSAYETLAATKGAPLASRLREQQQMIPVENWPRAMRWLADRLAPLAAQPRTLNLDRLLAEATKREREGSALDRVASDIAAFMCTKPAERKQIKGLETRILKNLGEAHREAQDVGDNDTGWGHSGGDVDRTFAVVQDRLPELLDASILNKGETLREAAARIESWAELRRRFVQVLSGVNDRTSNQQARAFVDTCGKVLSLLHAVTQSFPAERKGCGFVRRRERWLVASELLRICASSEYGSPYLRSVAECSEPGLRGHALPKLERLYKALKAAGSKALGVKRGGFLATEECRALAAAIEECRPLAQVGTVPGPANKKSARARPKRNQPTREHVKADGFVRRPSDRTVYVSASEILREHSTKLSFVRLNNILTIVKRFGIRWTRPASTRTGRIKSNRLLIHLGDWRLLAQRQAIACRTRFTDVLPAEIELLTREIRESWHTA